MPNDKLEGKTPFESASTPNLDYFARKGRLGLMYPLGRKTIPSSANSMVALLGNDPKKCDRGVYEAVGAGIKLRRGDLALRTNFATIDNLKSKKLIDRRAGRTLTTREAHELSKALNEEINLPCKFEFKSTVQHRGALVLRGGHSDNISSVNSGWVGGKMASEFKFSEPLDNDSLSKHSANLVNQFISQSYEVLKNHPVNLLRKKKGLFPANIILTRGAGAELPKVKQYRAWMAVNSMPLEVGIAKISGMKNFAYKIPDVKGIDVYSYFYKLLNRKIKHSIKTIKRHKRDFVGCYVHFKETDLPGHDNKPLEKKKMIEEIDRKFFRFLKKMAVKQNWKIIVTCDHSTPCELKGHSNHPVPVLVFDPDKIEEATIKDKAYRFNEVEARIGSLKTFFGKDFIGKVGLNR